MAYGNILLKQAMRKGKGEFVQNLADTLFDLSGSARPPASTQRGARDDEMYFLTSGTGKDKKFFVKDNLWEDDSVTVRPTGSPTRAKTLSLTSDRNRAAQFSRDWARVVADEVGLKREPVNALPAEEPFTRSLRRRWTHADASSSDD